MRLTKAAIDSMRFASEEGRPAKDVRWDDDVHGFGVRLWPSGAKTFIFEYRFRGRMRYLTIGKYGPLTLQQARELARKRAAEVLSGLDPSVEKQRLRDGETVADLARVYLEKHAKAHNKSWRQDKERVRLYILPALGRHKVDAIRRQDIARLHLKIGEKHPTTANRVLALLSSMWNRARLDFGILPQTHPNPTEGIKRFAEVKRDRFVSADEMPALAKAIDAEENIYIKTLIWLYLFTGLRKSELQSLAWENVDLKRNRIRLADTKAGRPHYLPVSPMAAELLLQLPRFVGNPFVFCGARYGRHIVNVSKPWLRIRKAAGLLDIRLHDLRRTVGSWMAQEGYSLPLIGRVLNHSNQATTAVYARFNLDPLAEALETTGRQLREASIEKRDAHDLDPAEGDEVLEVSARSSLVD